MEPEFSKPFLTAEWRYLAMVNYEITPDVLAPFVPVGTELDDRNGRHFVSLVGFLFLNTRVCRIPFPFHRNFEEVNLRFYVRRKAPEGWRRGVVFIREIVPRAAIAFIARAFYNENYTAMPMSHRIAAEASGLRSVNYNWGRAETESSLRLVFRGEPRDLAPGSEEEFITEHYWGYSKQRNGSSLEYRVEHPRWRTWTAMEATLNGDVNRLYGTQFAAACHREPSSAFLAEGSAVRVFPGRL